MTYSPVATERNLRAMQRPMETEKLLTPSEVASLFRVDPKTVTRWAKAGKLTSIRTLGGHRRYRERSAEPAEKPSQRLIITARVLFTYEHIWIPA